ncbi:MAG: hypothetical protein AAB619_00410 [Patescibacteria group bacterium]
MAGFKRTNIQGHIVIGDPELALILRRQSAAYLNRLFAEAQEHGQSRLILDGQERILRRHPDHTFTLEPGSFVQGIL